MFRLREIGLLHILALSIAFCILLSGCDGSDSESSGNGDSSDEQEQEQAANISGTWTGSASGYGETIDITMTITQTGDTVTGSYVLKNNGDTETGSVEGTYADGSGCFTFFHEGSPVIDGDFTFDGNTATGSFTYEEYSMTITLVKST